MRKNVAFALSLICSSAIIFFIVCAVVVGAAPFAVIAGVDVVHDCDVSGTMYILCYCYFHCFCYC